MGYEQDYTGYTAPTAPEPQGEGLDIFGKIEELLPLFVAVLAAIILAQILAPLLGGLLGLLVAILPGALTPPVAFPGGRSMADTFSEQARNFGFDLTDDQT